jgi:hypothetical protein
LQVFLAGVLAGIGKEASIEKKPLYPNRCVLAGFNFFL